MSYYDGTNYLNPPVKEKAVNVMAVDISRYEKFLEVRNNATKIIQRHSIHHELKGDDESGHYSKLDGGKASDTLPPTVSAHNKDADPEQDITVRHVGVITDRDELLNLNQFIQQWQNMANELTKADPLRFPKNAAVLAPVPSIIYGVRAMSISVGSATTSKKFTKQSILTRYDKAIKKALQSERVSHNSALRLQLERERALLVADSETHYRIRNTCGTETICTVTYNDGTTDKVRVPHVGVAFAAPFGGIEIRKPRVMRPRSDRLELMGIEPLDCSLSGLSGFVYRESEVITARGRHARRK